MQTRLLERHLSAVSVVVTFVVIASPGAGDAVTLRAEPSWESVGVSGRASAG